MKLIFCRRNSIGSWLIRFFTWSQWSHCMIVDGDHIIDSTMMQGGVRRQPALAALEHYSVAEFVEVPVPDEEAALEFARAQVGKPYDWGVFLSFIVRRDWTEPDAWFCNELAEAALAYGGRPRFRASLSRITPQASWMVI
jgi:uncharacterized protein YycO